MQTIYKPEKVRNKAYDTIVIGSGIGGLTCASLVAQNGKKVLVLEQHHKAGGACHTFDKKGYRFATGIHYVGGMGDSSPFGAGKLGFSFKDVLDTLTPEGDRVVWDKMSEPFETIVFGEQPYSRHEIYADQEQNKKMLKESFPKDHEAIDEYYRLVEKASTAFHRALVLKSLPSSITRFLLRTGLYKRLDGGFHTLASLTVQEGLDELTDNQELKAVLGYNWGCYGCEPKRASFIMQLLCSSVFLDGGYYPRNGPSEIPKKIIRKMKEHGCEVFVKAEVKRIVVDGSRARGVEMEDGTFIAANTVVSDAGFIHTITDLLPPKTVDIDFCEASRTHVPGQLHPGLTGFYLFVGLDKPPRELNLPESQYWIYPGFDTSAGIDNIKAMPTLEYALDKLTPKDMTPIFVGNPSDKDSTWSQHHPNTTVLELLTLGPRWEWFDKYNAFDKTTNSHGPDFELSKRRYADKMWERTVQVLNSYGAELPHSLDDVGHFEIGSPLSFTHYYEASRGALYGLDHDVQRFECKNYFLRLRPEVQEVSGLFLSGQDVVADSLVGAMMGGLLCAQKVLGFVNPLSLVRTSGKAKKSCFFAKADQVQPISVEDVYLNYPYGYY